MTTGKTVARRKLSLLDLATKLINVSKACKIIGYARHRDARLVYQLARVHTLMLRPDEPLIHPFPQSHGIRRIKIDLRRKRR